MGLTISGAIVGVATISFGAKFCIHKVSCDQGHIFRTVHHCREFHVQSRSVCWNTHACHMISN